jgi:hypothetical protein
MRDFGNVSDGECARYQRDLDAVRANELSFRDFFVNLQAGLYTRPISKNAQGQAFCGQLMFGDEDAAKVTDLASYDANISKLKTIRIRQVTGGGSFSSGTKAKFKLSIPIKAKYVAELQKTTPVSYQLVGRPWHYEVVPGTETTTPVFEEITISMLTMYHPSPLRIENVQHDAVLSINDPSDPTARTVILIPLKASNNTADESLTFFGKIAKHLTTISTPDSVTGLYPETDIPTGNDWNIKQVFWLDAPGADNVAKVTDALFTWMGAGSYNRVELKGVFDPPGGEIHFGWKPDGVEVRYFMLQTPVSISTSDLSFLTRSLPPTPAGDAIHQIPDPATAGNSKVLHKAATGSAASASCGVVRERMSNPGQGDGMSSLFAGSGIEDLLVGADGTPLIDKDSCNPFANNAKKAVAEPSWFTPNRALTFFFNFLILIAVAIGTWLGLFFVANKDYDGSFKNFSIDAGKVVGKLALQTSGRVKEAAYSATQSLPSVPALPALPALPNPFRGKSVV